MKIQRNIQCSSFFTSQRRDEYTLLCTDVDRHRIDEACKSLHFQYQRALDQFDLHPESLVFSRIHRSEIVNQNFLNQGAVSMVEQALLGGGIMSLHAYHLVSPSCRLQRSSLSHDSWTWCNGSLVQGYHCRMLWAANYDGRGSFNAYAVKMQSGASKAKCQRIKTHRFLGVLPAMSFEVVIE